jgi:hypothetical protein
MHDRATTSPLDFPGRLARSARSIEPVAERRFGLGTASNVGAKVDTDRRDGRVVALRDCRNRREALKAVGVQ